jgi:DNA-binding transcriptional ArsR family regulator
MKSIKTISNPEAIKLLGDETRRRILFLLRAKEMTVSRIAEELNLTPQAVYHHVKKLVEGEMVEVAREVRVDHLIESYYRATAETFNIIFGKSSRSADVIKDQTATALNAVKKLGFKIEFDETIISRLADLQVEINECCKSSKYEDAISDMENVDLITKLTVEEYAGILSVSDKELAKQEEIRKKLVNLLRSIVKKK